MSEFEGRKVVQPSPLPWKMRGRAGSTGHGVNDATGRSVCAIPSNGSLPHEQRNANARLIATAATTHEMLLVALRRIERETTGYTADSTMGVLHGIAKEALNAEYLAAHPNTGQMRREPS